MKIQKIFLPDSRELALFIYEFRQYFTHSRNLQFVPFIFFGFFFITWLFPVASPFVAVVFVSFGGLEMQFNNILFRSPSEIETLAMYPLSWKSVIVIKNLNCIFMTILFVIFVSMLILYFSPEFLRFQNLSDFILYLITIIFPLLNIGNERSIRSPRRLTGFRVTDLIECIWMIVNVAVVSVPYFLINGLFKLRILCLIYGVLTAFYWYNRSVKRTAKYIETTLVELCSIS